MEKKMPLPEGIRFALRRLHESGFQAYVVGGAVRDFLLGRTIHDYDMTTDALPQEILHIFHDYSCVDRAAKHGTIVVIYNKKPIEITSFRADGAYPDHRRPEEVHFIKDLRGDLSRRDFTINAMAYDEEHGILDFFEGKRDIVRRQIRCVGIPEKRFDEDALRMLRAVRFAAQLDFTLEEKTRQAILRHADTITMVSAERIREEFDKILLASQPYRNLELLRSVGLLFRIIPELERAYGFDQKSSFHQHDVYTHSLMAVEQTRPILPLRLAALLHDVAKPLCFFEEDGEGHFYGHEKLGSQMTRQILERMRYPKRIVDSVELLVGSHMRKYDVSSDKSLKKMMRHIGEEHLDWYLELLRADIRACRGMESTPYMDVLEERLRILRERKDPMTLSDMAIGGEDLKRLGMQEGKEIGVLLHQLWEHILEHPSDNTKEGLIQMARLILSGSRE